MWPPQMVKNTIKRTFLKADNSRQWSKRGRVFNVHLAMFYVYYMVFMISSSLLVSPPPSQPWLAFSVQLANNPMGLNSFSHQDHNQFSTTATQFHTLAHTLQILVQLTSRPAALVYHTTRFPIICSIHKDLNQPVAWEMTWEITWESGPLGYGSHLWPICKWMEEPFECSK